MSAARYLEFDSTYRDRVLYPEPATFVVEMSESGQGNKYTARDPVSEASPILIWNNNFISGTGGQNYISNLTVSPATVPHTQGNIVFQVQGTGLKQVRNFYVGAALSIGATGIYPPTAPIVARRILDYQPLDTSNGLITLDSALPDAVAGTSGFYIGNPTPIPTDATGATVKFFIPGSNQCVDPTERTQQFGLGGDNYYVNYYVMNTDTGNYRKITAFDALTRLATIESPLPASEDWSNTTNSTANFVVRKSLPAEGFWGGGTPIIYATPSAVQLQDITPSPPTGRYDGDFLRISPLLDSPTPYNVTTTPPYDATITAAFPVNCQTEERRIRKYVFGTGNIVSISGNVVTLDSNASSGSEYVGAFLSNTSIIQVPPAYVNPTVIITAYDSITKQATTNVALAGVAGNTWLIRTCFLSSPFSVAPNPENLYEIEPFTRDNSNPFVYTGSLVSSQEVVCYEVELLNLILPNILLASGRGGRPIFYPYLYVELQQVSSAGTTNRNIIYSNNPNSSRMLFRAVVDDTPIPAISPFIKIDGDGMVHTIKFKPNDSFRFGVYHANGQLFKTILSEQYSPMAPNDLTQISACFAFKRV